MQLDIKRADGIPLATMVEAVQAGSRAWLGIVESMASTMAASRACLKKYALRVDEVAVAFRDLLRVIGSGGAVKQKLQRDAVRP